jgi:hypothetical protein
MIGSAREFFHDGRGLAGGALRVADAHAFPHFLLEAVHGAVELLRGDVRERAFGEDAVEMCKSDEIERGFATGLHNLRGVHSRSLYEGGQQ